MKAFFKKLVLGKPIDQEAPPLRAIDKRVRNIKAIWNNEQHDDIGITMFELIILKLLIFLGESSKLIKYTIKKT
jgi:hypothetical protein